MGNKDKPLRVVSFVAPKSKPKPAPKPRVKNRVVKEKPPKRGLEKSTQAAIAESDLEGSKRRVIVALYKSYGSIHSALKSTGIDYITHAEWMDEDAKYANWVLSATRQSIADLAEHQLIKILHEGNPQAILFALTKLRPEVYNRLPEEGITEIKIIREEAVDTEAEDLT